MHWQMRGSLIRGKIKTAELFLFETGGHVQILTLWYAFTRQWDVNSLINNTTYLCHLNINLF